MLRVRASSRSGHTGVPFGVNPRSSFHARAIAFAAIAASLALVHCEAKKAPAEAAKLGEPIGVRVDGVKDASGKPLGSLTGAFAITKGQAAEPLVPGMARV